MLQRLITGVILAVGVIALFWWGPSEGVKAFLALFCFVGLTEYSAMGAEIYKGENGNSFFERLTLPVLGTGTFIAWVLSPEHTLLVLGLAFVLLGVMQTLLTQELKATVEKTAWNMLGLLYVAGLFACASAIVGESEQQSTSRALFIAFIAAVSAGDTLAYFAGRAFGKHPLSPKLSPKKTIEGAIGGLAGSAGGAVLVVYGLSMNLGPIHVLLVAAIVGGATAQVGDLFESLLKRTAGIKDSGRILPGHGGVLDRVDGILFGAPVFLAYQTFIL